MIQTEFLTESISFSVSWFSGSAPIVTVCLLFATSHSLSHSSKLNTSFRIESSGKFSVIVLRFVNLPLVLLDSLSARGFSSSISAQFGTGEFDIITGLASCADARLIKVPLFKWLNLKWPCPDSYRRPDNPGRSTHEFYNPPPVCSNQCSLFFQQKIRTIFSERIHSFRHIFRYLKNLNLWFAYSWLWKNSPYAKYKL